MDNSAWRREEEVGERYHRRARSCMGMEHIASADNNRFSRDHIGDRPRMTSEDVAEVAEVVDAGLRWWLGRF